MYSTTYSSLVGYKSLGFTATVVNNVSEFDYSIKNCYVDVNNPGKFGGPRATSGPRNYLLICF
jgi:hypothetical protein